MRRAVGVVPDGRLTLPDDPRILGSLLEGGTVAVERCLDDSLGRSWL
jgi:hypothetical protein